MFIFLIIYETIALQSYTDCANEQYYNTATGTCTSCPSNTKWYNISLCVCDNTQGFYRTTDDVVGFQYSSLCSKLSSNCTQGQVNLKYSYEGAATTPTSCVTCSSNAYSDPYHESCTPCPDKQMNYTGSCECPLGYVKSNNHCIQNSYLSIGTLAFDTSYQIQFDSSTLITSSFIANRYQYAIALCYQYNDINACQMQANLCVLQMYDLTLPICSMFLSELSSKIPTYAPALYPSVSINTINLYQTAFAQTMKLDDSDSLNRRYLNYTIRKFELDGTFISETELRSELILCPHSPQDEKNSRAFGLNMKIACTIDLNYFLYNYNMYLYELRVTAVETDGTISPQNVYVLVKNLIDKDGNTPNTDTASSSSMFVNRFFMVDIITAKKDFTSQVETPEFIRYASQVKFVIIPSSDSYEQINVPYLYIEYTTVRASGSSFGNGDFQFNVQIAPNSQNYWTTIIILFVIYNVIIFIVWLFRIYVWTKANPRNSIRSGYSWQLIKNIIRLLNDSWTDWMFYFLFFMTAYWFVFFKFQNTPFLLMLDQNDPSNYSPFYGLFYTIFALRIIHTFGIAYMQSSINIYFIDWEKTEIHRPVDMRKQEEMEENELLLTANRIKSKVSVWRTLLVANEFNELSTVRTVSVEWTLILVGFVLIGLGFQNRFIESPDLIETQPYVPVNPILQYFLVQFVYLVIGFAQLIGRRILNIWEPYPYEDFVDLCTIANVSIFILDDNLHGYYIHGENPLGFSEGGIPHLQECLRNESKNKGKNRGLVKEGYDSQLCTYELFVPPEFKTQFELNYEGVRNYKEKREIKQLGIEHIELQKFKIEQFLKSKINEVRKIDKRANFIRTKETAQRYFDYPPDELAYDEFNHAQLPYFYKDPDYQYRKVMFSGYEMYFLVTDIIIFTFFVLLTDNVALSVLLQYFCTKGFEWLKQEWQKSNISTKTKIDKRFLI